MMPYDSTPPNGAIHAYDNMIWPPNKKMVSVALEGHVTDEMSIARDGTGIGVSSAYIMINHVDTIILRDEYTDMLGVDGSFSVSIEIQAVKGSENTIELYAADTNSLDNGGPNEGLIDKTRIRIPYNLKDDDDGSSDDDSSGGRTRGK